MKIIFQRNVVLRVEVVVDVLQKISAHPNQKNGICEVLTYILCLSNIYFARFITV
ncbi:hypothetical protein NTGZN8_340081 [Candidatus Nitrotoga fabula]|uniref:Uncharacterized protein n=1 Tax=Candidatus Nitrotoga fabula TaxID=2182327 RepID=A0A916BDQ2_9PROT|nr:hypothetical protein NTGZN8_340081 [Candidatus Nitrotoga fabula]